MQKGVRLQQLQKGVRLMGQGEDWRAYLLEAFFGSLS